MSKSISIVILAALLLSANASFIEHIYNSTHLRGNVKLDTSDGVKVGYNGGLYFDNGFLGFDIANIGGNLKAAVRPGSKFGNQTNSSIDYSGDIQVSQGNHSANISVNGTAGVYAEFGNKKTDKGGEFDYKGTITNENNWTVNAGNLTAEGTSEGCLHGSGNIEKDGNQIYVENKLKGGVIHKGTLTGDDNEDTFEVAKFGKLKLEKEIWIKDKSENDHFGDVFPTIGYAGEAKIKRKEHIVWNDDTVDSKEKGKGRFSGLIWYDKDDQNNTYIRSVKHAKSAEFVHGGKVAINDKLHDIYGGAGIVSGVDSAVMKLDNDTKDFRGGFFDSGNMHYIGVDITKPKSEDELLLEKMQNDPSYVMGDIEGHDKKNKVKTAIKTSWAAGKGVKVDHNDDGTVDVNTHGGAVWEVDGWASNSKKPIHERGGKTYNSSFTFDKNTETIKNILVKFGKDPKEIEKLRQRFKMMRVAA